MGTPVINWGKPFKLRGVTCFVAELDGETLIASGDKPKFCFSASSQEEAIATAIRGLTFYGLSKTSDQ